MRRFLCYCIFTSLMGGFLGGSCWAQIQEHKEPDGTKVYTNAHSQTILKEYKNRAGTIKIHQPTRSENRVTLSSRSGQSRYQAPTLEYVAPDAGFHNIPQEYAFSAYLNSHPLPERWIIVDRQRVNLSEHLVRIGQKYNIDPWLLDSVIKFESNYRMPARSHVGAVGLMQLMPDTARSLGVNPYSFSGNLKGGAWYLAKQLHRFKRLDYALAAYNAGPNAVKHYRGLPPFAETQNYVKNISHHYYQVKNRR